MPALMRTLMINPVNFFANLNWRGSRGFSSLHFLPLMLLLLAGISSAVHRTTNHSDWQAGAASQGCDHR